MRTLTTLVMVISLLISNQVHSSDSANDLFKALIVSELSHKYLGKTNVEVYEAVVTVRGLEIRRRAMRINGRWYTKFGNRKNCKIGRRRCGRRY